MQGQLIETYQVQVYKRAREQSCTQAEAAKIAGISERSGRRIEKGESPSSKPVNRTWRTRQDPLAAVWERELEPMLFREPRLEATTLYEYLQEEYPGQYQNVRRTVQRRVASWKAQHGLP